MSAAGDVPRFLEAWLEAQQALARLAGAALPTNPGTGATLQSLAEPYRQLFAMPGFPAVGANATAPGASLQRYQQAAERVGRLLTDAAADAGRRLGAALASGEPAAPPITTLRELHSLWIDCGEAAWSAVAHRDDFAAALAELLAALVALGATGQAR